MTTSETQAEEVWIVQGDHPFVPGRSLKVFGSLEGANKEAVELVNLFRKDLINTYKTSFANLKKEISEASSNNWAIQLKLLKILFADDVDAEFDVWITKMDVNP